MKAKLKVVKHEKATKRTKKIGMRTKILAHRVNQDLKRSKLKMTKILQINVDGRKEAHDLMEVTANQLGIDVLL